MRESSSYESARNDNDLTDEGEASARVTPDGWDGSLPPWSRNHRLPSPLLRYSLPPSIASRLSITFHHFITIKIASIIFLRNEHDYQIIVKYPLSVQESKEIVGVKLVLIFDTQLVMSFEFMKVDATSTFKGYFRSVSNNQIGTINIESLS